MLLAIVATALGLTIAGLTWYGRRQTRTHAAMSHTPLVEHHDTEETT